MLPFLHHRLQLLEKLLNRSNSVLAKYTRFELDLATALTEYLDETIDVYHGLNQAAAENELLALKAQFVSAEAGTHPMTLERVTNHRREMVRAIALYVLQQSAAKLRSDAELATQKLNEGTAQLRPIALLALQKGIIPAVGPAAPDQFDEIWRRILADIDTMLAARQAAMQFSVFDIQLLLLDLIEAAQDRPVAAPSRAPRGVSSLAEAGPATPPEMQFGELSCHQTQDGWGAFNAAAD